MINKFTSEPYLKSNIVKYAQRHKNFTPILRGEQPDSLWRNLSYSSVLQKAEIEMAFAKLCKLCA